MILDPTCSARSIWFDKARSDVIYGDIRVFNEFLGIGKNGRWWNVEPNVLFDYTFLPFPDNSFEMVVFDPPHLENLGLTSWLAKKYGKLFPDWRDNIRGGFDEFFRVLQPRGILILKWSEAQIKLSEILKLSDIKPLFGHTTNKGTTHWICFMKE